jgi:hypothetical protein
MNIEMAMSDNKKQHDSPFNELLSAVGLLCGDHALEHEVVRGRVGLDVKLAHVVREIEQLVRQRPSHEVGAEVVVEEVNVGAVGLARGGIERAHPELEEVLHILPPLLRHVLGEGLLEPRSVESGGVGGHWVGRRERAAGHNGGEEGGRRVGGGGVSPVLSIEGAPGARVRRERGGANGVRRERRLLLQRAGGDRGAEEEVRRLQGAVAAEEQ